ncbi:hypothetical protein [Halarcobacter anaerophilus]|nr:hypothetical protein [Halarcobacter anaerophilus]
MFTNTFATSSMSGIEKQGYFDDDDNIDILKCEESRTMDYKCLLILNSGIKKVLQITNNNECSEFSINAGKKGEIIFQCGSWGVNNTYYYQYDSISSNWYLIKLEYYKLPMNGPDDIGEHITYTYFIKKWAIDDCLMNLGKNKFVISKNLLKRQPLYKKPNIKTKMYLIKGDRVEVLEGKDDWLYILYHGKKDIKAWIPKNSVE